MGAPAYLQNWNFTPVLGDCKFTVSFAWDEDLGTPGAILVRNAHHGEFYLKTVTLDDVPGRGPIHFVCNSWVYPDEKYQSDRVFFANKASNSAVIKIALLMFPSDRVTYKVFLILYLCRRIFRMKCQDHFVSTERKS